VAECKLHAHAGVTGSISDRCMGVMLQLCISVVLIQFEFNLLVIV
jgi:hypothetical protein